MIAVTAEELERAESEAAEAQQQLEEAERVYSRNPASAAAYERHQGLIVETDHVARRARVLRSEYDAQQVVRDRRTADGEAAARELAGDVEGLTAARAAAVAAAVEATAAMRTALDALTKHDQEVRAVGEKLAVRGLLCREDEATGAGLDGSVWVRGELSPLVDGGSVLGRLLVDLVAERDGRHPLARLVWAPYGGVTAARGRDEVLALVRAERGR